MPHNVFRAGQVHVCRRMCDTCIFRHGTLMHLTYGRRDQMVTDAIAAESTIICHATLDGDNSACRGFFNSHKTAPLQIAERLNMIAWDDVDHA